MEEENFWNHHSPVFLEMAYATENRERLDTPHGYGTRTGACGDSAEFFILVEDGIITHISFDLDGCVYTMACCNAVVALVKGKSIEAAWEIKPEDVADFLETLPRDHFHCAQLCVGAMYLALSSLSSQDSSHTTNTGPHL